MPSSRSPLGRSLGGFVGLAGLACLLSSLACAPVRDRDGALEEGGPGGPGDDKPCQTGQRRCEGNNLMVCEHGSFAKQQTCAVTDLCDATLGCIQCSPKQGQLCVGDTVRRCNPDGSIGMSVETCQPGQCQVGRCSSQCNAAGNDLIYVVDVDCRLLSFNPRGDKNEFKLIGDLKCPAGREIGSTRQATPFSMSVDRMGRAWVLYNSGEVFSVSTADASCKPTTFAQFQSGFETFGMGFVSDVAGSNQETLFIAGGGYTQLSSSSLGSIDAALTVKKIGAMQQMGQSSPELTGTGNAEL